MPVGIARDRDTVFVGAARSYWTHGAPNLHAQMSPFHNRRRLRKQETGVKPIFAFTGHCFSAETTEHPESHTQRRVSVRLSRAHRVVGDIAVQVTAQHSSCIFIHHRFWANDRFCREWVVQPARGAGGGACGAARGLPAGGTCCSPQT